MQTWTGAEGGCGHVLLLLSDCITVQRAPSTDSKFRIYGLKFCFSISLLLFKLLLSAISIISSKVCVCFIKITVISNINYI